MKIIYKFCLFANAFLFMNLLFFGKEIYLHLTLMPTKNLFIVAGMIFLIANILAGLCGFIFIFRKMNLTSQTYTIIKKQNDSGTYYFGYFSLFVLLFLCFDLSNILNVVTYILLYAGLCFVYCRNNLFYINPTILMTKKRIFNIQIEKESANESLIVLTNDEIIVGEKYEFIFSPYEYTYCIKPKEKD